MFVLNGQKPLGTGLLIKSRKHNQEKRSKIKSPRGEFSREIDAIPDVSEVLENPFTTPHLVVCVSLYCMYYLSSFFRGQSGCWREYGVGLVSSPSFSSIVLLCLLQRKKSCRGCARPDSPDSQDWSSEVCGS